jgi:hypothetical protein
LKEKKVAEKTIEAIPGSRVIDVIPDLFPDHVQEQGKEEGGDEDGPQTCQTLYAIAGPGPAVLREAVQDTAADEKAAEDEETHHRQALLATDEIEKSVESVRLYNFGIIHVEIRLNVAGGDRQGRQAPQKIQVGLPSLHFAAFP